MSGTRDLLASVRPALAKLILILTILLLGGCALGPRHVMPGPAPSASVPDPAAITHTQVAADVTEVIENAPTKPDFWQQLRASFVLGGCDGNNQVGAWIHHYSDHPRRFQARMRHDLPLLRYVADMTMKLDVPGEFALLPWVESNFRAIPGRGDGPAGMWQIMPPTGRALGLRIDARYDGRLDIHESTMSALRLLRKNHQVLGDWRLANMAFNTGRYRIKHLLKVRTEALDDRPIPDLPVSQITRDHLAKLSALGCIVRDPAHYGIRLPRVIDAHTLVRVSLEEPLDLRLAAKLSDLSLKRVRRLNAAYVDLSMPASKLMLPKTSLPVFRAANDLLGQWGWRQWSRIRLLQADTLVTLVEDDPERVEFLAQVNGIKVDSQLEAATALWLPQPVIARLGQHVARVAQRTFGIHRVHSGDTLWDIAQRFHISVRQLRQWNHLRTDLLHPGQKLRLSPPP